MRDDADRPRHWRDWLRHDPTGVGPLGSYAAKRCPVRTQLDVLRPVDPAPPGAFLVSLGAAGIAHEDAVVADLVDLP